ncbi:MAG: cation diffusion facilitator family transporter [Gammaproteobacteria bacterium]|nr:cation diffusion facilitator family transporter [Gammaproteobacteria bacterium]
MIITFMQQHTHHHSHGHHHHGGSNKALLFALVLTLLFAFVEVAGGLWADSLALLGDASHMFSDTFALGLALFAAWLAKKPPSVTHSYGLMRAEVVAAMFNGVFMLIIVGAIVFHAIERLNNPHQVQGMTVMIVAGIGMVVNIFAAYILMRGEDDLNTRGALLHVMGDLLGSVAALLSGLLIHFFGWQMVDPILSVLICILILGSTLRLLREALNIVMEGVPSHLNLEDIGMAMANVDNVRSVHDLHVWTLASGKIALSAHIMMDGLQQWPAILRETQQLLHEQYEIEHITLQPETTVTVVSLEEGIVTRGR